MEPITVTDVVVGTVDLVWGALQSNFWTSLIGALAGAAGGAWAAQIIAERGSARKANLDELRALVSATSLASFVINTLLNLKIQQVAPLQDKFNNDKIRFEAFQAAVTGKEGDFLFEFDADLHETTPFRGNEQELRRLLFEKVISTPVEIALLSHLTDAIGNFNDAIRSRNELVRGLRGSSDSEGERFVDIYFGRRNEKGHIDTRYSDLVNGIGLYLDGAIVYGCALVQELRKRISELSRSMDMDRPKTLYANVDVLIQDNLLPDLETYRNSFETLGIEFPDKEVTTSP